MLNIYANTNLHPGVCLVPGAVIPPCCTIWFVASVEVLVVLCPGDTNSLVLSLV